LQGLLATSAAVAVDSSFAALPSLSASNPLHACAFCADFGERTVMVSRQLNSYELDTIRRLRFSNTAEFAGTNFGIFNLAVSQQRDRWVFELRDT
jgi:hypothetical protein